MNNVISSRIRTMLLVFVWTNSIGFFYIAAYILIDNYASLGVHYGQLSIFLLFINILSVIVAIFYRRHFVVAFMASTFFCTYCFFVFWNDHPLTDRLLIDIIERNRSMQDNCKENAMQSINGVATCLGEDSHFEWKRALIYIPDAETYPTGELLNNKTIELFNKKLNAIRGNDAIDEINKGTPYEVKRLNSKFLLISYVLYSM